MKVSKKMVSIIIIAVVIVITLGFALLISFEVFLYSSMHQAKRAKVRLLYETDHQALLAACRNLSTQVATGELKPGTYRVRGDRDPEASRFPQPILDLAPSYVYIDESMTGRVLVEMLGGLGHFGLNAYPEDYEKPSFKGFTLGDKKLIDGLWYYDDGYDDNPEYNKTIEALRSKGQRK